MSVCNSVTSACNIIQFQTVSVFCHRIKGMLRSKVTDDSYICGPLSEHLQINQYRFLRIIRMCTDFSYQFLRKIGILRKMCTYMGIEFWA